jgi:hypothetical protein
LNDVLHEQKTEFDIDPELVRYPKGINRSRWLKFFRRKRGQNQPLLPAGYVPTNKRPKQKRQREEQKDVEEKEDVEAEVGANAKKVKSGSTNAWIKK